MDFYERAGSLRRIELLSEVLAKRHTEVSEAAILGK